MARVSFWWLRVPLKAHGLTVERHLFAPADAAAVLPCVRKPSDDPRMGTVAVLQRDRTVRLRDVLPILQELPGGRP